MTTWRDVHVGDTVSGRDGREWLVIDRREAQHWVNGGSIIPFVLSHAGGTVPYAPRLDDPAPLVRRGEGLAADAAAVQTMIDAGIGDIQVISETFSAPAAPAPEVKRDRYGRYLLPHPETGAEAPWTRVTTVARTLADEFHLTKWKMRQVARGIARRADLVAGVQAADPVTDKGTLDRLCEQAMEAVASGAGATMGTALHSLTALVDRGVDLPDGLSEPVRRDLDAYQRCMIANGLQPEWVERIVCVPQWSVAGTFDRIVAQPSGNAHAAPLAVLDVKTSNGDITYSWLETAMQLAAYARASHVWDPATQEWFPMPEVDQSRGLVLHLPSGKGEATLYAVDLMRGWDAFDLAMQVRAMRSQGKSMGWAVAADPAAAFRLRVTRAPDQAALAALRDEGQAKGLWTEEVNAAAAYRWEELYGS